MDQRNVGSTKQFVPSGVDAQSWIGFEHRIQERRFNALVETITGAVARRASPRARRSKRRGNFGPTRPNSSGWRPVSPCCQSLSRLLRRRPISGIAALARWRCSSSASGW
jgi:hypothetical protein